MTMMNETTTLAVVWGVVVWLWFCGVGWFLLLCDAGASDASGLLLDGVCVGSDALDALDTCGLLVCGCVGSDASDASDASECHWLGVCIGSDALDALDASEYHWLGFCIGSDALDASDTSMVVGCIGSDALDASDCNVNSFSVLRKLNASKLQSQKKASIRSMTIASIC